MSDPGDLRDRLLAPVRERRPVLTHRGIETRIMFETELEMDSAA